MEVDDEDGGGLVEKKSEFEDMKCVMRVSICVLMRRMLNCCANLRLLCDATVCILLDWNYIKLGGRISYASIIISTCLYISIPDAFKFDCRNHSASCILEG